MYVILSKAKDLLNAALCLCMELLRFAQDDVTCGVTKGRKKPSNYSKKFTAVHKP